MPKRRGGPLEERLRRAVAAFTRQRGTGGAVAAAIGRPSSWLSEYKQGFNHAGLDTSIALMRVIGWRSEDLLSLDPVDEDALELLSEITRLDAEQRAVVREFLSLMRGGASLVVAGPSRETRKPVLARPMKRAADK